MQNNLHSYTKIGFFSDSCSVFAKKKDDPIGVALLVFACIKLAC